MGERDHGPAVDYLRLGCRLTIVGGVRERVVVAYWALLVGPSTSPLEVSLHRPYRVAPQLHR